MTSKSEINQPSLNARVSAVALVAGSIAILVLAMQEHSLTPLRLMTLAINTFGVWAFCDEMGMRKPLNRAGFVAFVMAMFARSATLMEPPSASTGRYFMLYAFALMVAVLIWSVAFLHKQRELKFAGTVGALVSIAPILALVFGHLALGAGAFFGIGALLAAVEGAAMNDYSVINAIDTIFALWALVTAWFLWRGSIKSNA